MKVLSLFDGISCGMVALERAGIPYVYFIATRFNDFYPSFWYVGNLWQMPAVVYCARYEPFARDGCIMMKPTDEFICVDELLAQENKQVN